MTDQVSVSSVVIGHACPLRLYLEKNLQIGESPRYTVSKQVSYHLGHALDPDAIWSEVQSVMPLIDPAMRVFLDGAVERCRDRVWPLPTDTDVAVGSETLGVRGVVDKVFSETPFFAITRSSEAPAAGVYAADRIRVACYCASVRETLDLPAESGYVEYVPSGVLRICTPQPRDRRAMVQGIHAARKVMAGEIPKKPIQAPCTRCPHEARCTTGARRLSDLL
jgi:CRISPR-associated exonuclease Cas4